MAGLDHRNSLPCSPVSKSRSTDHLFCNLVLAVATALMAGCAGEDFSQPDPAIAARLAKAKEEAKKKPVDSKQASPPRQPKTVNDTKEADETITGQTDIDTAPAKTKEDQTETVSDAHPDESSRVADGQKTGEKSNSGSPETLTDMDSSASKPIDAMAKGPFTGSEKEVENGIPSADAETKSKIDEQQKTEESTVAAGASLLDKLTAKEPEKTKRVPRQRSDDTEDEVRPIDRFGRFAIAARTWLQLRNQLSKQFYTASTESGRRFAASSGQRSLGVLNTQEEAGAETLAFNRTQNNVIAQKRIKQKVFTQPVHIRSGIVRSIELLHDGNTVVVGTQDGRLLARSCAQLQDWDIYAQDLMAFQDEFRSSTKLGPASLTVVRALDDDVLLTVDANYKCCLWRIRDVVHTPISPDKLTEELVQSPEAPVMPAEAFATVDIPKSHVLNLTLSDDKALAAIVTSDEKVTIFSVADGSIVETVAAAQLNDTQPVVAIPNCADATILVGLADGRICRRSLDQDHPVSSTDDQGQPVDYEMLLVPDLRDRSGAITSLEPKWDKKVLYVGRIDGSLLHFDLPRKQIIKTVRLHKGPILNALSTKAGLFTVGEDRFVKLSDKPVVTSVTNTKTESFDLPKDDVLKTEVVIEDPNAPKQDKFTRTRHFNRTVQSGKNDEISPVGIRPADPVLALYEHRLRVARTPDLREAARLAIARTKQNTGEAIQAPPDTDSHSVVPTLTSQVETLLDFQARPLRPVVMDIANDGLTICAAQKFNQGIARGAAPNQPVFVWDTETATCLRTWRRLTGIERLTIKEDVGFIFPSPPTARLSLHTGQFQSDPFEEFNSWALSPDQQHLVVTIQGTEGVSRSAVQQIHLKSGETKHGLDAFEGRITAIAFSPDGSSLYVNLRERARIRLLELDATSFNLKAELSSEATTARWKPSKIDPNTVLGATAILPTPDSEQLVTYGRHPEGWQFRIWRKKRNTWPIDQVSIIPLNTSIVETTMTDTPFQFVDNGDREIAVVTTTGVSVIGLRKGRAEETIELPSIDGRRPVTLLTPDGKLAIAGDRDGKVYLWKLKSLKGKPRHFAAHSGPIVGLGCSSNGRYLATAGEENRIRVWDLQSIDPDRYRRSETGPAGE